MRTSPLPGMCKHISTEGYKRNSPDVNKKENIIPSGGNAKVMKPGKDYKFPGTIVKETKYKK